MQFISWLGQEIIVTVESLGVFFIIFFKIISGLVSKTWSLQDFSEQMERIGVSSVFMVAITSAFTGMVIAVQTIDQFIKFGATGYIGGVIGLSITRELSPVLTGLVVSGRVGASMAAEISSMKVTEQLDALKAFGLDDVVFVGAPRLLASFIMLPALTIFSDFVGIGGAFLYVLSHGVNSHIFRKSLEVLLDPYDIWGGIFKAAVFGILIAISACTQGFRAGQGAKGVGVATTRAVVWSNMLILATNYILSSLLFGGISG